MVASPRPPDRFGPEHPVPMTAEVLAETLARSFYEASRSPGFGGGMTPPPASAEKTIHNEVTKLKANTVNAAAIAFFIGGGIAPLVGVGVTGFTVLQAVLGLVWFFVGLTLHSLAQNILKSLLP